MPKIQVVRETNQKMKKKKENEKDSLGSAFFLVIRERISRDGKSREKSFLIGNYSCFNLKLIFQFIESQTDWVETFRELDF